MKGFVYILECSDGTYYVGSTNNLDLRIQQHEIGIGANYTSKRRPLKLVFIEEHDRIDDAFYREQQIKKWSASKKQALINGDMQSLRKNSKRKS